MGWYGDVIDCPNCGKKDAGECQFRNDNTKELVIKCSECGLVAYAPKRLWIFTHSYIDKSIIGQDPEKFDLDSDTVNKEESNEILKDKPLDMF